MSEELLKKAKKKKKRTAGIIAVIAALVILGFAGFGIGRAQQGADGAGQDGLCVSPGGGGAGTVSLEIDCSDLSGQMDRLENEAVRDYIPEDGLILPETEYDFSEGETVYDCLYNVCRQKGIQMESSEDSVYKSRYIEGIGHLYEMDAGKRSGWTYYVDGEMPDYGCSKYRLEDGRKIRWVYVVDYMETQRETEPEAQ